MATHVQLEEANQYFHYGCKEGYFNEEDFMDLTDDEFVAKMRELMDIGDRQADAAYDAWKERDV